LNASLNNLHPIITLFFSKWRITQNMNHPSPNLTLLHQLEMHALIRPGESFVAHLLEISPELRKAADAELSILEELREKIGASFTACARYNNVPINPEQIRSAADRVLRAFMDGGAKGR